MKGEDLKEYVWEATYLGLLAVILSYCWISFRMEVLAPVSFGLPFVVLAAAVCGALVFLFIKEVRRALYASLVMCVIGCVIAGLFFNMPRYQGLSPGWTLDFVLMGIIVVTFTLGGSFVAAYLSPD